MQAAALCELVDCLARVADHAREVDTNGGLRRALAAAQARDRVPEERMLGDPPLLRLEAEAGHTYLSMLLHIAGRAGMSAGPAPGAPVGSVGVPVGSGASCSGGMHAQAAGSGLQPSAQERLVGLILAVLERFGAGVASPEGVSAHANRGGSMAASPTLGGGASECAVLAPLVVACLQVLRSFDELGLRACLPRFWPVLARLVAAEHAPPDVQRALSDLMLLRLGPLIGVAGGAA